MESFVYVIILVVLILFLVLYISSNIIKIKKAEQTINFVVADDKVEFSLKVEDFQALRKKLFETFEFEKEVMVTTSNYQLVLTKDPLGGMHVSHVKQSEIKKEEIKEIISSNEVESSETTHILFPDGPEGLGEEEFEDDEDENPNSILESLQFIEEDTSNDFVIEDEDEN
jgi:hypothetical protein